MRKILSIILTAAMLMSVFAAIPFSTSAEVPQATKAYEFSDFSTEKEAAYHSEANKKSAISIEKADDTQGNAAKFTGFISLNKEGAWASSLRLTQTDSQGNVSSFKVKPGATYDLTFKMKVDWDPCKFTKIDSILIFYVGSYNGSYFAGNGKLNDWSKKVNFYSSAEEGNQWNSCSNWTDKHFSFTVPSDIGTLDEVVIMPVIPSSDWAKEGVLWMDDIAIAETQTHETNVDFEDYDIFYGKKNNIAQGAAIADTLDNSHGKALKFTNINASCGDNQMWPQCAKISSVNKVGAFRVYHGRKYQISFDIKKVTADVGFDLYAHFNPVNSNVGQIGYRDYTNQWAAQKVKIKSFSAGTGEWENVTAELTVSPKAQSGGDYSDLTFVPYISGDSWSSTGNQEIYIDNVSVKVLTKITTHNLAVEGQEIYAAANADISTVQAPMPGARVKNWYTDSSLTTPAEGKVGTAERELWATLETVTGDFENGNNLAVDGLRTDTYQIKPYVGTVNSYAITDYEEGRTPSTNSEWPPIIQLLNPDGTPFLTYTDHEYKVEFDMKVDNPSLLPDGATLALLHAKPPYKNGKLSTTYPMINDDSNTETKINFKYGYKNADGSYGTSGWYRHFTFNFVGLDSGLPVYVTPWQAKTFTYFDNIRIIDVTAQKAIKDQNGYELARGYAGETVTIPDAADADFVYYADENGAPVSTTKVISKDKALTKVNSQIAVTGSDFNKDNSTVSFTTRFGGIGYTEANGGVTVNTITVENTRYFVEDMGLLVAPTEKVTGELTLDNLCGATNVSGTDLMYSATGTDELQLTAQIKTSKYNREYTVVGYVKCAGGKVIYSKTRNSIAKSYNAAARIESVDDAAHTKYNYTLVSNSEFNSAESLSNGWNPWGQVSNPSKTDPKKPNCDYYSVESATYVKDDNLVLDLKKTSDTTYDLPELLSKYNFTTGYLEVGAKFANTSDFSCSIWLNSAAVPAEDLTYGPNDNDIYVWPEIDIMESFAPGSFSLTLHNWGTHPEKGFGQPEQIRLYDINDTKKVGSTKLDLTQYHIYGFERTPEVMRMYVDGKLYYELGLQEAFDLRNTGDYRFVNRTENEIRALFVNPTYLILGAGGAQSLALGQSAKSTIDYVRFYK